MTILLRKMTVTLSLLAALFVIALTHRPCAVDALEAALTLDDSIASLHLSTSLPIPTKFDFHLHFSEPLPRLTTVEIPAEVSKHCDANIDTAQGLFKQTRYEEAQKQLEECITALEKIGQTAAAAAATSGSGASATSSMWLRPPFRNWFFLFFYRALIGWRRGGAFLAGAMSDARLAVRMNPHPEYFGLQSAIAAASGQHEAAFLSTLHELTLHLGLRPHLADVCRTTTIDGVSDDVDDVGGSFECNFRNLGEWLENKFGWNIEEDEPKQVFKLWETVRIENQ